MANNLIIGDSSIISNQDREFELNLTSVKAGEKYIISCSDKFPGFVPVPVEFVIQDNMTRQLISNTVELTDLGPYNGILTINSNSDYPILRVIGAIMSEGSVKEVMLNKGETPLPWDNNLSTESSIKYTLKKVEPSGEEITIGEIRIMPTLKDLLSEEYPIAEIPSRTVKKFKLNSGVKKGDVLVMKFDGLSYGGPDTSCRLVDGSNRQITDSVPFWSNGVDVYGETILSPATADSNDVYLELSHNFTSTVTFKNLRLEPLNATNGLISPVFKGEEKVWERQEVNKAPYIIIPETGMNPNYGYFKVLINPEWIKTLTKEDPSYEELRLELFKTIGWSADARYVTLSVYAGAKNNSNNYYECMITFKDLFGQFGAGSGIINYIDNGNFTYEDGYIVCECWYSNDD